MSLNDFSMARFSSAARAARLTCVAAIVLTAAGCASKSTAPVVERSPSTASRPAPSAAPATPSSSASPAPVSRTPIDPRAPTYTVQRGDTLYRIALEHGQAWRDVAAWNNLEDPSKIEVGQVLRVLAPESVAQAAPVSSGSVAARPITAPAPSPAPATPGGSASPAPTVIAKAPDTAPSIDDEGIAFAWPAKGTVLEGFSEAKNKGIDLAGKAGDPVMAAADGKVVYAANGLRGYGNLVIIKHNNTFLTAYAHNQSLAVRENQAVKKGQKIAEMGSTDAERVKLHFEIRRLGRPIDPLRMLPEKQ